MARAARPLLKDERLDQLAEHGNVAQFVSFSAGQQPAIRHWRLLGEPNLDRQDLDAAIGHLLATASSHSINVRSFRPDQDKGCPFRYGIDNAGEAVELVRSLAAQGYLTIVNETIDIHDGGVSGVALGGVLEFAPDDTPRAVEKEGTASLPAALGLRLLRQVYGFAPDIIADDTDRLEFSVHPMRVGYRGSHTLWWEHEPDAARPGMVPLLRWPNRFSRHLGDKAYGLLMADLIGLPVPRTTVLARRVAPFSFGRPTGTGETWLRTAPLIQAPGRYPTSAFWSDPFTLLAKEDPAAEAIASVLAQEGVDAKWSGATLPSHDPAEPDFVQGVPGQGESFMLGEQAPAELPQQICDDVRALAAIARAEFGPVRLEWVHDGKQAWVVQLHLATHFFQGAGVLNEGAADHWLDFQVSDGLEALRVLVEQATAQHAGITVHGRVGLTSHVGDLLRRAGVPGRLIDAG